MSDVSISVLIKADKRKECSVSFESNKVSLTPAKIPNTPFIMHCSWKNGGFNAGDDCGWGPKGVIIKGCGFGMTVTSNTTRC